MWTPFRHVWTSLKKTQNAVILDWKQQSYAAAYHDLQAEMRERGLQEALRILHLTSKPLRAQLLQRMLKMPKCRQFRPKNEKTCFVCRITSLSENAAISKLRFAQICSRNLVTVGLCSATPFCTLHQTVPSDNYWSKLLVIPASFISFPHLLLTTTTALLILLGVWHAKLLKGAINTLNNQPDDYLLLTGKNELY